MAETRFTDSDNSDTYALSGFHLHRFDYPSYGLQRPVYDLAFYVRESILNQNLQKKCMVLHRFSQLIFIWDKSGLL